MRSRPSSARPVGTALLEVTQAPEPCLKLGLRRGNAGFVHEVDEAGRTGAYLRIIEEREISDGDPATVASRPGHELTVAEVHEAYRDGTIELPRSLTAIGAVPESWRKWAQQKLGGQHSGAS